MELKQKSCVSCDAGMAALGGQQAQRLAAALDGWELGEKTLEKRWRFKNYAEALAWVNRISEIAEAENHHPDIAFGWGYVRAALTTHAIGGLSENDFIVAAKMDEAKA